MDSTTKKIKRSGPEKRAHLPKQPFQNIALSLSGDRFRATSIHLGLPPYRSTKNINNSSLLELVRIHSTVSAGTFAGVKYASTIKKGGSIEDCYKSCLLYTSRCV